MPPLLTVIETPEFNREARRVWTDDELVEFVNFIAAHPLSGSVIPGSGGFRKIRWSATGHGKRGGSRIIYFFFDAEFPLLLTSFYAKAKKPDLTQSEINKLKAIGASIKRAYREERGH